jgi:type II restriction/modification system DNA methylase subunit YeeA
MTNTQIQLKKRKIARACIILVISITIFGTITAFLGYRNNTLKNNILSTYNSEIEVNSPNNSSFFESQKNK